MSGSGRKSQYRKSITDNFLYDFDIPTELEEIVKVRANRGSNTFEVESANSKIDLAKLPNKFNKVPLYISYNYYKILTFIFLA